MTIYRQIHVNIWQDAWFLDLAPDAKLLFVYLFSNSHTRLCGLYEIAPKIIEFETGLSRATINTIMADFDRAGKVHWADGWVWVVNFQKHNRSIAPTVLTAIEREIQETPNIPLKRAWIAYHTENQAGDTVPIPYPYRMDTLPESVTVIDTVTESGTEKLTAAGAADAPPNKPEKSKPESCPKSFQLAILKTCGINPETAAKQAHIQAAQAGKVLLKAGVTEAMLITIRQKWDAFDWRSDHPPTITQLRNEWQTILAMTEASTNGSHKRNYATHRGQPTQEQVGASQLSQATRDWLATATNPRLAGVPDQSPGPGSGNGAGD